MRKEATVTVEGKEYKIYELRVKEIMELGQKMSELSKGDEGNLALLALLKESLPKFISVEWKALAEFAPSELEEMWVKFQEVNKSFLGILSSIGMKEALNQIIAGFKEDLSKSWQGLL